MTTHIACHDARVISSLDGVRIVLHDFGGAGAPLLLSHATGFHAHCWEPLAAALVDDYHVVGLDHRGYGDADAVDPTQLTWRSYGDDALTAAREMYAAAQQPIVGVGHSMGGASLLMAAHREPHLFRALFVFEPIVFPPPEPNSGPRPESPLPAGARKRRAVFPSFDAALENFAAKPPLASFHPVAREAYVRHGFKATDDGQVALKCSPEHEARTYETGGTSGAWDDLPEITTPTWVLSGAPAPFQPSSFAHRVAERLPHSTYVQFDEMGHFGPLEHPIAIAEMVRRTLASQK